MLANRIIFEQPSVELTQGNKSSYQTCRMNNIALHGAEDIVATTHDISSSDRIKLEEFVKTLFKSKHGANIQYFMPELMALSLRNGPLMAVCGLRKADQEPLFLERYLASNIEQTISEITGETISRSAITEIGNLAVAQPEYVRCLLASINLHLHKTDADWAVFTGIRTLKNALIKLNIPLLSLGMAHIEAIPYEDRSDWGGYYDEKPEVMAIKRNYLVR